MRTKKVSMPINVSFKAEILSDGNIARIKIRQLDNTILITKEQAVVLVEQIQQRLAKWV